MHCSVGGVVLGGETVREMVHVLLHYQKGSSLGAPRYSRGDVKGVSHYWRETAEGCTLRCRIVDER